MAQAIGHTSTTILDEFRRMVNRVRIALGLDPWARRVRSEIKVSEVMRTNVKGLPAQAAFDEHGVLVLPDQDIGDDQQIAFTRGFGELERNVRHGMDDIELREELIYIGNVDRNGDLYPIDEMPPPVQFYPGERPTHPAIEHLRTILGHADRLDEAVMKKITACYFAVITHLDEQLGELLGALKRLDLEETTRVLYTADHGYNCGNQYILGLFNLYQRSVSVPMIMAGPGIPAGRCVRQIASHVDL